MEEFASSQIILVRRKDLKFYAGIKYDRRNYSQIVRLEMPWISEPIPNHVVNFLADLFKIPVFNIQKRLQKIQNLFIAIYMESELHGALIGARDPAEPRILEFYILAFRNFLLPIQNESVLHELKLFCMKEKISVVTGSIQPQFLINMDEKVVKKHFYIFKQSIMVLSRDKYHIWLKRHKLKNSLPSLSPGDKFHIAKNKKATEFQFNPITSVSFDSIAKLQNKAYSCARYIDKMVYLSRNYPRYNNSLVKAILEGVYGDISDVSCLITAGKQITGYLSALALETKNNSPPKTGFIIDLAVDPTFQGIGLGKILLESVIFNYFREEECNSIELTVTNSNKIARRIYQAFGFEKQQNWVEGVMILEN